MNSKLKGCLLVFLGFVLGIAAVIIAITLVVNAFFSMFDNRLEKEEIFDIVEENKELLLSEIEKGEFIETLKIDGIQSVDNSYTMGVVNFDCGGAGMGSATYYTGFYYTNCENLTGVWCAMGPLVEKGDGFYGTDGTDNYYYTEKICNGFYYYEAGF